MAAKFMRKQYMERVCSHREYYGQFVTPTHFKILRQRFDLVTLFEAYAKDQHFNSISLRVWDSMPAYRSVSAQLIEAGDWLSLAGNVCIYKEAALQLLEAAAVFRMLGMEYEHEEYID